MKNGNKIVKIVLGYIIICMVGAVLSYFIKSSGHVQKDDVSPVIVETEAEYKESCKIYAFKEVLRNPTDYIGEKIKIEVSVYSSHDKTYASKSEYYYCFSDDDKNSLFFDNPYVVFDGRNDKSLKLLVNDVIVVYGEIVDPSKADKLFLVETDRICIDMKYVELIRE